MRNDTLIDTLELGSGGQKQKYEIYGDDDQTPTYAVIYRQQGDSWQALEEKLTLAGGNRINGLRLRRYIARFARSAR